MRGCALCVLACREQTNVFLFMLSDWSDELLPSSSPTFLPSVRQRCFFLLLRGSIFLSKPDSYQFPKHSMFRATLDGAWRSTAVPIFDVSANPRREEERANCYYLKLVPDRLLENCIWRERERESGRGIFFLPHCPFLFISFFPLFAAIHPSCSTPVGDPFLLHFLSSFFSPPYQATSSAFSPSASSPVSFNASTGVLLSPSFLLRPCVPSLFSSFHNFASIRSC